MDAPRPIRRCAGRKADGSPCGTAPLLESTFCLFHDPDKTEEAAEARRVGGQRRRRERIVAGAFDFGGLDSVSDIRRLLEVAAMDTLGLENSVARNRALAYLAQVATSLLQAGELEHRLNTLEFALAPRRQTWAPPRR